MLLLFTDGAPCMLMAASAALQTFANRVGTCANAGLLLAGDTGSDHVLRWFEAYATALNTGYFQVGWKAPARPDKSSPVLSVGVLHARIRVKGYLELHQHAAVQLHHSQHGVMLGYQQMNGFCCRACIPFQSLWCFSKRLLLILRS